ncbi:hypothetical protein SCHPADRAFT_995145 [Schizopora paradoxa]|uniref:BTB domain-containing protein n=1 Tax=Schizopora paradoxa TaxID=27342 RepID=A0A0H2SGT6_9AGAM|nr:hypothetical protein SCHPADRAFT_995145 [Schizopora paradoxa]
MTNDSPKLHAKFYYRDGSHEFIAGSFLYRLHASMLSLHSIFFSEMFELGLEDGNGDDGVQAEKSQRLILIDESSEDFDCFLEYIYLRDDNTQEPIQFASSLLKLSTKYMADKARLHAIKLLESHPCLTPVLKLSLACKYAVTEWIRDSVFDILRLPLGSLTCEDATILGFRVYIVLMTAREKVSLHRLDMAFATPEIVHFDGHFGSSSEGLCKTSWENAWWNAFSKRLLFPDKPLFGLDARETLRRMQPTDVHAECLSLTLQSIEESGVYDIFDELLDDAVKEINGFIIL